MFLSPVTELELLSIIQNKIKNKWSAGPDEFPPAVAKLVKHCLLKPLCYLINLSFEQGAFPSQLKTG